MGHTATYSPEDDKLRLYPAHRLDTDEYGRVKSAGFTWAPKQELFVAVWGPEREDLLIELAGEIDDEDKSLVERAEERSERFDDYSDRRRAEASAASETAQELAGGIPMGQPILVGHHSEARARRDAEKIQNATRKAVRLWDTADYWRQRATGAMRHAKYLGRPDVRARRIKKLESEERKLLKNIKQAECGLRLWSEPVISHERAVALANVGSLYYLADDGRMECLHAALTGWPNEGAGPRITDEKAIEIAANQYRASLASATRWLEHTRRRLEYERAMLLADGGIETDRVKPEKGGACRCWASPRGGYSYIAKVNKVSVSVLDNWGNGGKNFTRTIPFDKLSDLKTAAEVEALRAAGRLVENEKRTGFRVADQEQPQPAPPRPAETDADRETFEAMRKSAEFGVRVVCAPKPIALHCRDFLDQPDTLGQFDRILMNPPFENASDIRHIEAARKLLKPGGRLVAICANGPRQKERLEPQADYWEPLPEETFKSQGTSVRTALLVLNAA